MAQHAAANVRQFRAPAAGGAADAGSTGPLRGAKATTWEGGQRVPCIIRWPRRIARPASDWASPEQSAGGEPVEIELHDLTEDPYEKWNRTAEEPEIVIALRSRMIEFAEQAGALLAWTPDSTEP